MSQYILNIYHNAESAIRVVIFVVYGASTGHTIHQQLHEAYVQGDGERIARVIHQLWLDADDTASYTQDSVWDAITAISDTVAGQMLTLAELLSIHKDSVVVQSEVIGDDDV